MADFEKAFAKIIKAEGGYVNNPNDKGGETYMGITRKNHSKLKMWKLIDELKNILNIKDLNTKLFTSSFNSSGLYMLYIKK